MPSGESVEIDNNLLKIQYKNITKLVTFKFPIRSILNFENSYVVLIEPDIGQILNENVYGVSTDGNIIWQLPHMLHVYEDSPYTGMLKVGDKAKLYNWEGSNLTINPMTGEILEKGFSK